MPTTDENLSSMLIIRRSCDHPCDSNPDAPDTVERGRNERTPVSRANIAWFGHGCASPGSHKPTTGITPAACHDAESNSQALSQRALITHHSDGRPDFTGDTIRLCKLGLNPRHVDGLL